MESVEEIKSKALKGMMWRFAERIAAQLVSFVVSIILARILLPEQYGLVAITNIFIVLADVFVTSGFGTALIQAKEVNEVDYSTVLYTSIGISIFLYLVLFFISPILAKIYNVPLLLNVLRVMGLRLPIAAINSVQQARISRNMEFKKFFFATFIGTVISAIVGIYMAYNGFGVWALVMQNLTNCIIDTIVLAIAIKWIPLWKYSVSSFKKLFNYGWKLVCTRLLGTVFDQLKGLIIGKKFGRSDLAYYNRGESIPNLISHNVEGSLTSVLLPSFAKFQDDKVLLKKAVKKSVSLGTYIVLPLMLGLAAISNHLVLVLLTDKWKDCIPFFQIVCFINCFSLINTVGLESIKAIGRSDILLKLEFIKKPIYFVMVLICVQYSPVVLAFGHVIYSFICYFINTYPCKTLLNYSYREQFSDVIKNLLSAVIMGYLVWLFGRIKLNETLLLILQIMLGIILYILLSIFFHNENYKYLKETILRKYYDKKNIKNSQN